MLKDGDTLRDTKSAMVLEDLIGQFLYKSNSGDNQKEGGEQDSAAQPDNATPPAGATN